MDIFFTSFPQTITELLVLIILIHLLRRTLFANSNPHRKTSPPIPEPPGSWPLIGHLHLLRGQEPLARPLGTMADDHGPIFSLRTGNHRLLVVSSSEMAKQFLSTNDKIFATRPNIAVGKYMGYENAIFALAPYGDYWREIRKLVTAQLLSGHRMEALKAARVGEIDKLTKELHFLCAENRDVVVVDKVFDHFTFNMSIKMIAGEVFDASAPPDSDVWRLKKALEEMLYLSGVFVLSDAVSWLECLDFQGHLSSMKRNAKELDYVLDNWLKQHLAKRSESGARAVSECESDFMDVMLGILAEDTVMSGHDRDTIVKATTEILIFTSSESTALTLTWALSLLLNHPKELKAVQEELDFNIGKERWVQEQDIKNLKYLQAVVKETLRMYPPAPLTGLREAMEDCFVAGYHVRKGTRLIVNLWKLHRDPRVWSDPCEFRPERFMTTHANTDFIGQDFEYLPFSFGRRSCPGMNFGLHVVHLTLARLLQGFDVRTVHGGPVDMKEGLGISLHKVNSVEVVLNPRLARELYLQL